MILNKHSSAGIIEAPTQALAHRKDKDLSGFFQARFNYQFKQAYSLCASKSSIQLFSQEFHMLEGVERNQDGDGAEQPPEDTTNPEIEQDQADSNPDTPDEAKPTEATVDSDNKSEHADAEENQENLSEKSDELMSALPPAFRDAIEKAGVDGSGVLILTTGDIPAEFLTGDTAHEAIDGRQEVRRHIETYEAEREHVKEYILPTMDHQIAKLTRRREAIADQYDLNPPGQGVDFSTLDSVSRKEFKERVLQAEKNLPEIVKGQDQAITPVITALKRAVTGTRDVNRPIMSVLEVGRTGVGKTLLAKALAEQLSTDKGLSFDFLKIDCSEYSSGHEGARLTGAPPGYIGFEIGGQFKAIQENPFQVVLFDEIEKGSQQLHNMLLQILEDGEATRGNGEKVDFRNCILIMTSNVGVGDLDKALNPIGYTTRTENGLNDEEVLAHTASALKRAFAPEFLNRLDGVIPFKDLSRTVAKEIAELEVGKVIKRVQQANEGCVVTVAPSMIEAVLQAGFSPEYGAREIRRAVQELVEEPLAIEMFAYDFATVAASQFTLARINGVTLVRHRDRDVPLPSLDEDSFDSDRMRFAM